MCTAHINNANKPSGVLSDDLGYSDKILATELSKPWPSLAQTSFF